ncbi:MAG: 50S ribosomal protein L11 methyltransferase [Lachnospiraceae bacterium]|nr:50S ribosomal protein L11 methyltransferase [Lachnospiraceae bacterium]
MKWKRYTIDTTTKAVDLISSMLEEHGIEGIEIEDNVPLTEAETRGMFIDILPELPPDEGKAKISFYLEEGAEDEALLSGIREGLLELRLFVDVGEGTITASETEDKDWINNWKQYFHPFTVDDILIKPTWEAVPKEHQDKQMIELDPGTAFGTGSHETTQLCIRQLQKYLKEGDRVLDIGTGSGILGIVALKLGASFAFGTDLDENAVRAARENAEGNGFSKTQFVLAEGDILTEPALMEQAGDRSYDLAVANILAPVIILLAGETDRYLRPGGIFITSGILNTKEEDVRAAFEANPAWELLETTHQNDWVSITARKR